MSRPKISVTLGSARPGGIDIALAGLAGQTEKDFEVIFVDGLYHERHAEVLDAVKRSGLEQPFIHVPNHRYSGTIWGTPCAGYNTGFALATGEVVVMMMDYAYAPPTWLETHWRFQRTPRIAMAPHEYRTLVGWTTTDGGPAVDYHARQNVDGRDFNDVIVEITEQRKRFDKISVFPEWFKAEDLDKFPREASDAKCEIATGPLMYTYFNTKNESFPLNAVLAANGMDEHYDLGRGPGDPDLGLRMHWSGLETWCLREAIIHCLNPRRILPNMNILIPEDKRLPPPYDHRWYIQDGYNYFDKLKSSPVIKARNPIDLMEMRKQIWDWREKSQETEAILPRNVISDNDYWQE